jgi:hypothetical protein
MPEKMLFTNLANSYWVPNPSVWSLGDIQLDKYFTANRPGCANLVWLAATTTERPAQNAVLRQVMDTMFFINEGHPIERWAATGSLALFHDTIRGLKLPKKASWLKDSSAKALDMASALH